VSQEAKELKRALGPLRFLLGPIVSIADQIKQQMDEQELGEEQLLARLRELSEQLDDGLLSEEEYFAAEENILARLEALQDQQEWQN
jgi:cytochrome c-type biogenesis protein CcmH/NrfG